MPFRSHRSSVNVHRETKPTLITRLCGRNAKTQSVKTTTTVTPAHNHHGHHTTTGRRSRWVGNSRRSHRATGNGVVTHHQRRVSMGDKISGALLKLRGSLTGRPGVKAAGTRRMHGTDGKGSHRSH